MPVITRAQINNSNNSEISNNSKKSNNSKISKKSNAPFVNLMKNVVPIRECAKGDTYLYKTRKFITDIDTGIANILCKGSKPKRNLNKKIKFVGIDENNNNNSSISNDIKFQTSNIIQENSVEKQTVRNLRSKKPVNYSNMDIPIYLSPESMNSIRELSTLEETPIYETFNNDLHNNPKLSNIIKSQYYMEREDPDYVFEEDYDDDEIEELAQVKVKITSPKVSKEILTKVTKDVSKSLSKEVKETILQNEKNNKENIVMMIVNRLTVGRRKNIVSMILDKIERMKPKAKISEQTVVSE